MYTAVTITQMTPMDLELLIERVVKRCLENSVPDITTLKGYLTKREAAEELSCSIPMIDKLLQQGKLDKVKVGAKVLIPRDSIDRILNNRIDAK